MAKKKKPTKKAKKLMRDDVIKSIAIFSVLLNILFILGIVVFSTDGVDQDLYDHAYDRLCVENYSENLQKVIDEAGSNTSAKTKITELKVRCLDDDFLPYYNNAVETYTQTLKN